MPDATDNAASDPVATPWWFFRVPESVRPLLVRAGGKAALVYLSLASHATRDWKAWPSITTISEETGLVERAVRYNLRRLEQEGAIIGDEQDGRATVYTLSTGARICPPENGGGHKSAGDPGTDLPGGRHENAGGAARICPLTRTKNETIEPSPLKKTKGRGAAVVIPESLDSELFTSKWEEWKAYRKEKKSPLTTTTIVKQLAKLASWGQDKAIASLDEAMEKGWAGFFEPKQNGERNGHGKSRHDDSGVYNPAKVVTRIT
ncbi:MAG: helix-turn-helix domain-containing protein [Thermoguttaceae bacterium]